MKPTYDELEEIVALATCVTLSTQRRDEIAMTEDYAALAGALRRLHADYRDNDWTVSIIDALDRAEIRARHDLPL